MFGEPIPRDALDECILQTQMCDCMLLVGTSAAVYPAAGFPLEVKRAGGALIEVNPNETPLTEIADVVLRAPSVGSLLPACACGRGGDVSEKSVRRRT
jgi:NAD-dependent deacetylase